MFTSFTFPLGQTRSLELPQTSTQSVSSLSSEPESSHSAPASKMEQDDNLSMGPTKLKLAPFVIKSEPTTPIYATNSLPEEAPDEWFAPVNYREKIAILTIEHIPYIIAQCNKDHTQTNTDQYFSPRLLPVLDRMKFYFARMMAHARCEAENGVFDWSEQTPGTNKIQQDQPILPVDVMSGIHVEVFLARIEEIRMPENKERVVYRRYWRILEAPAGLEEKVGGVVSSGSAMEHHAKKGVKTAMDEHWDETPKVLVAEFEVNEHGFSVAGRMVEDPEIGQPTE